MNFKIHSGIFELLLYMLFGLYLFMYMLLSKPTTDVIHPIGLYICGWLGFIMWAIIGYLKVVGDIIND